MSELSDILENQIIIIEGQISVVSAPIGLRGQSGTGPSPCDLPFRSGSADCAAFRTAAEAQRQLIPLREDLTTLQGELNDELLNNPPIQDIPPVLDDIMEPVILDDIVTPVIETIQPKENNTVRNALILGGVALLVL